MAAKAVFISPPKVDNFVLTEKLGQGSYATVYKAFKKVSFRRLSFVYGIGIALVFEVDLS